VKTRVGSIAPDPVWWKALADMELPALAMHGRTFKQLYSGEADWEVLKKASPVIKESGALFLGNGDVKSLSSIKNQALGTGHWGVETTFGKNIDLTGIMDGVLVGRAAVGNPWALRKDGYDPSVKEKLNVAIEHAKEFEKNLPGNKFEIMRKHLAWYAHGFSGAGSLRKKLVKTNSSLEVSDLVNAFLDTSV